MQAVFGFALIRNFADATECFREDVMLWCNTIAKVVHDAVNCFSGAPNRNLGDVFVCVWRIPDAHPEMEGRQADNALASFLKSMVDVYNENQPGGKLAPLNKDERLVKRFGEKFMVRLGYGLHIGWAIEGAIGSTYKIDASYLSPNVNMSARLMAATGQFGTPLLISHWLHEKFSGEARKKCRMLDRVTVKGSVEPMGLYTFDIKNVPKQFGTPKSCGMKNARDTPVRTPVGDGLVKDQWRIVNWKEDEDVLLLQKGIDPAFMDLFGVGVQAYLKGDWGTARDKITEALKYEPNDGPSETLMKQLKHHDFCAPEGWQGFRALTQKY
jgi:class 3 adenylate cyclase